MNRARVVVQLNERERTVATKTRRVPVSTRALVQRINRKLAHENQKLVASRGQRASGNLGNFYIVDLLSNSVEAWGIDTPESLGREVGALAAHEYVDDGEEERPTSKPEIEATGKTREAAMSAAADACNLLQRSKLIRLGKKNPARGYAFDEVINWLKAMKKAD